MDRMADAEHDFTSHVRSDCLSLGLAIPNAVDHRARAEQSVGRQLVEFSNQLLGYEERFDFRVLDLRTPTPLIVVNLACLKSLEQTQKMVEHMSVMRAERGSVWTLFLARVSLAADVIQQRTALLQHIFDRRH